MIYLPFNKHYYKILCVQMKLKVEILLIQCSYIMDIILFMCYFILKQVMEFLFLQLYIQKYLFYSILLQ